MNDSESYSREPLSPEELALTRWANGRTSAMWETFGPVVLVVQHRKFWLGVLGAVCGLNWQWLLAGLRALAGVVQ